VRHSYDAALTSLSAGDWDSAARALKPIVDAHPELPGPAVNLGIAYVHLNRNDEARKIVDSAVQHSPGFAPAQHQLGRILAAAGEFQAADAAYARALSDDANYALAYYDRAVLNELYLQKLPEALQDYEAYQRLQAKPDEQVARWIVDLRRRTGAPAPTAAPPAAAAPASQPAAPSPAPATSTPAPAAAPTPAQPAPPAPTPKKGGSGK
jgi:tetratricopeptide (TPR) repeat protein